MSEKVKEAAQNVSDFLLNFYNFLVYLVKNFRFRLTLQGKYSVIFSVIVLSMLFYLVISLYTSEKEDLISLSREKFDAIFTSMNTIGEEAISVGKEDQIALKTVLTDLFKSEVQGLEKIFFTNRKQEYYVYADISGNAFTDQPVPDSIWQNLLLNADTTIDTLNHVYLTKRIVYKTANRSIFMGYSHLVFSLDHINQLIEAKRSKTLSIAIISFFLSLFVIIAVTYLLTKRIKQLRFATQQLSEGNYIQLQVKGNDEVADLTQSFNQMSVAVKERLLMARYVSDSTIEQIKTKDDMAMGGSYENVCVFFSDIRGFTAFSEKNQPDTVVRHLNHLLDLQVEIIKAHHGDIDKFVGDEIMAVFRGENKEDNAVSAAVDIQKKIKELYNVEEIYKQLKIGVGINTGEVVSGNIGSKDRMDFTLIGDTVNTGARLCGAAAGDEIIISQFSKKNLKKKVSLSKAFSLDLKNKTTELKLYRVKYD
jgi:class 3 adenylate cyclase